MSDMLERAALLMDIQSQVANISPMMTSIAAEAANELKTINDECKKRVDERAEKIRREEQVAQQTRLEAQKKARDENPDLEVTQPLPNDPKVFPTDSGVIETDPAGDESFADHNPNVEDDEPVRRL